MVQDLRRETTRNPTSFVDEVQQREAQNRQMQICWKDDVLTINREHFLKVEKLYEKHTGADDPNKLLFMERLFCMLMRYESIGGPGYQVSMLPKETYYSAKRDLLMRYESMGGPGYQVSFDWS